LLGSRNMGNRFTAGVYPVVTGRTGACSHAFVIEHSQYPGVCCVTTIAGVGSNWMSAVLSGGDGAIVASHAGA